jgi:hypothetical protein
VHRFDVETGTNLPAFANLGGTDRIADISCSRRATAAAARSSRRRRRSSA